MKLRWPVIDLCIGFITLTVVAGAFFHAEGDEATWFGTIVAILVAMTVVLTLELVTRHPRGGTRD